MEDKMDIMGKKVVHKHLGEGIISDYKVKNGVSYIVVDFSEDNHKEFLFPDIFKDFVKAKDEDFEEYAKELLEQKQKRDNVVKLLGRESTGMRTFSIANQLKKPQMISFICAIFLLEPTIMFKKQDMRCLIIGQSVRYMRG